MALSLRAEQKSINDIFTTGEDVYVIPEYQRPYSWTKETCYQLYTDITSSFLNGEDYFLSKIIMARNKKDRKHPNIVDGQQRLITLWLFMKILTILYPDITRLKRTLLVESVLSEETVPRIESKVYEHDDQKNIETILKYEKDDFEKNLTLKSRKNEIDEKKCSKIEANALYLYQWLNEFHSNLNNEDKRMGFLKFFLENVYMLPIELDGESMDEASDRALTIFETLNNRGQILEDSDIFKARLYKKAKDEGRDNEFIDQWQDLNETCLNLNISVDDLFRFYYHILRGREGQTNNEASLREYLTKDKNSALNGMPYKQIVEELSKISDILQWLNTKDKLSPNIARWLQLVDLYTNQYPRYALVNFIFTEGSDDAFKLERFLRIIVRYYYYRGATLQVKYETYRINKLIACHMELPQYDCYDMAEDSFDHMGTLRKGYALLAHYLQFPISYVRDVSFDTLVSRKDMRMLPNDWDENKVDEIKYNIANVVALDIPRRSLNLKEKALLYCHSTLEDVKNIFDSDGNITYKAFKQREDNLKKTLMNFFIEKENGKTGIE